MITATRGCCALDMRELYGGRDCDRLPTHGLPAVGKRETMEETPQEPLELVKEGYRAFGRGDLDWVVEHCHERIVVQDRIDSPDKRTFRGRDGFLEYVEQWSAAWDDFRIEPTGFVVSGDRVVVLIHQVGRGKGSGMEIHEDIAHLWIVRDQTAVGYRVYSGQEDALAAVGASAVAA